MYDLSLLQNVQTVSGALPASYLIATTSIPGRENSWGMRLTTHLHREPRLRTCAGISPLSLYAYMVCIGVIYGSGSRKI